MEQTSEEKTLAASDKKLREARKKGQVVHSTDMVSGVTILCSIVFVSLTYPFLEQQARAMLDEASHVNEREFAEVFYRLMSILMDALLSATLPLLALTVTTVVVANVAIMKGFVFSVQPLVPDFERINPVSGLKRLVGLKSFVELGKALFKIVALAVAFILVFRAGLQSLFQSPSCGAQCTTEAFWAMIRPIAVTVVLAFLSLGAADVLVQRWLYLRDMRMTKTEAKRERKDMDGDPLIRRERAALRRTMASMKLGLKNTQIVITAGADLAIGVRYVRDETPVPISAFRVYSAVAQATIAEANRLGIPLIEDAELAQSLERVSVGAPVPERTFMEVARYLVNAQAF